MNRSHPGAWPVDVTSPSPNLSGLGHRGGFSVYSISFWVKPRNTEGFLSLQIFLVDFILKASLRNFSWKSCLCTKPLKEQQSEEALVLTLGGISNMFHCFRLMVTDQWILARGELETGSWACKASTNALQTKYGKYNGREARRCISAQGLTANPADRQFYDWLNRYKTWKVGFPNLYVAML